MVECPAVRGTCWYVAECPAVDCTKAAFKRAQVKSIKSAPECRERLRTHLQNSCLHMHMSQAAINSLVGSAEIHAYPFEDSQEDVDVDYLPARNPKRARSSDGRSDDEGQIMEPGERRDKKHFDGGASLLHMGITVFGERKGVN